MDDQGWRNLSVSSAVQHPPADLFIAVGHALLTLGIVLHPALSDTPLRVAVGLPFVLFVPGYVLVATLFPEANTDWHQTSDSAGSGITGIGRVALSFGLSMVVVPLVGLVLNYTPLGLRLVPILVSLTGVVLVLAVAATGRRRALPPGDRFVMPWRSWLTRLWAEFMQPDSWPEAALNVLLLASILVSVASVGYAVTAPTPGESSTEFYLLTETDEGTLTDEYPTRLVAGEPQSFVFGIENQENRPIDYTVLVKLDQVQVRNNSTEVVRTERLQTFEKRVENNGTWRRAHSVRPRMEGEQLRLTYLLYRGEPPANPTTENAYRELRLWINVTPATEDVAGPAGETHVNRPFRFSGLNFTTASQASRSSTDHIARLRYDGPVWTKAVRSATVTRTEDHDGVTTNEVAFKITGLHSFQTSQKVIQPVWYTLFGLRSS